MSDALSAAAALEQEYEALLLTTASLKSTLDGGSFPHVSPSPTKDNTPSSPLSPISSSPHSDVHDTSTFLLSATDPNSHTTPAEVVAAREMPSPNQLYGENEMSHEVSHEVSHDVSHEDHDTTLYANEQHERPSFDEFEGSGFHSHVPDDTDDETTEHEEDEVGPMPDTTTARRGSTNRKILLRSALGLLDVNQTSYSDATRNNSFDNYGENEDDEVSEHDGFYDNPRVSGDWSSTDLSSQIQGIQQIIAEEGKPAPESEEASDEEASDEDWANGRKSISRNGREWIECDDGAGNVYFADKETGETKWEMSEDEAEEEGEDRDELGELEAAKERAKKREDKERDLQRQLEKEERAASMAAEEERAASSRAASLAAEEDERAASSRAASSRAASLAAEEEERAASSRAASLAAEEEERAASSRAASLAAEEEERAASLASLASLAAEASRATSLAAVAAAAAEEWDAAAEEADADDNATPLVGSSLIPMRTAYAADTPLTSPPLTTPFSPPPLSPSTDVPSSIFQSLIETQTNLDKHLVDFHETSNAPRGEAQDEVQGAASTATTTIVVAQEQEVDKIAIRVAKIERALEVLLDAKIERTAPIVTSENDFVNLSQITDGGESLTEIDARSIANDTMSSFKVFTLKLSSMVLLLAMLLNYDATYSCAARGVLAVAHKIVPTRVLIGSNPRFTIRSSEDNWCFDGGIFRPCTTTSLFTSRPAAASARLRQFVSVDSPDLCLGADKKGALVTKPCVTAKGITMDATVFEYERGVLALRDRRGERLCVVTTDSNAGRVGKCSDVGYTPMVVAGVAGAGLIRFEDAWVPVELDELSGDAGDDGGAGDDDGDRSVVGRFKTLLRPKKTSTEELDHIDDLLEHS